MHTSTACYECCRASCQWQESLTMVWPESCTRTYTGSMWQIESHTNLVCCTDVKIARLHGTLLTVAHRPPTLSVGSVSDQPHSNGWCATTLALHCWPPSIHCAWPDGLELCLTTSAHSRTLAPSNRAWKLGCFPGTSVPSALETFVTIALYKLTYTIPYHTGRVLCALTYTKNAFVAELHRGSL